MRQQRLILIKTNPDGTVKERYRVLEEPDFDPRPGYIEIKDQRERELAIQPIENLLHKDGKLQEKPRVKVVVNKMQVKADGEDEVEVKLVGVPEGMDEVEVKIGNMKHKVNPKEPFFVTTAHVQVLEVGVAERTLRSEPVMIRGVIKV